MKHFLFYAVAALAFAAQANLCQAQEAAVAKSYCKDAADFGFSPLNDGLKNAEALQRALDGGGTVRVSKPGTYAVSKTVLIDDNTNLVFDANVFVKKVKVKGETLSFVFVNRGAYEKKYNRNIRIEGLHIIVNGVDEDEPRIIGMRGHLSFFYVKDLRIENFRCYDLMSRQFCIQISTFENIIVNDAIIHGKKDGIHLGRGRGFKISNCEFKTFDDAIALNAHDYSTSNPELGWIEDGVVENVSDLAEEKTVGYFCRILAGSWSDWREGMTIQRSDSVVSEGRIYRNTNPVDGKKYVSKTRPTHNSGTRVLDGIRWTMVQTDAVYTAGVRNVVFRDIFLYKPRVSFSVHFDNDKWSRSYYPDARKVSQENLVFENVHVYFDEPKAFLSTKTPIDVMIMKNCFLKRNQIAFVSNSAMKDFGKTHIKMMACVYDFDGEFAIISNRVKNKALDVFATGTTFLNPDSKPLVENVSGAGVFNLDFAKK